MKRRQSFPIIAVTERSQILTIPRTQGATISYWSRRQRAPISIEKGKQHLVGEIGKRGQLRMWEKSPRLETASCAQGISSFSEARSNKRQAWRGGQSKITQGGVCQAWQTSCHPRLPLPLLTQEYKNQSPRALPQDRFNLFDLTPSHIQMAKANYGKIQNNQVSSLMTFSVPLLQCLNLPSRV